MSRAVRDLLYFYLCLYLRERGAKICLFILCSGTLLLALVENILCTDMCMYTY